MKFVLPWEKALKIAFQLRDKDPEAAEEMLDILINEFKNLEIREQNLIMRVEELQEELEERENNEPVRSEDS